MSTPLQVYCNWAAYDELSDKVELDHGIAMRQFEELLRLRRAGVRLDAYLMDCFWYDPQLGYRSWRTPHFPDQGQDWLDACRRHGVVPGVWIGSNSRSTAKVDHPDWAASVSRAGGSFCMFHGPFLAQLDAALRQLHARGVRLFKFDFLDQNAAPAGVEEDLLPSEIRRANASALQGMLARFRREHPEALFTAYNGYEEVGCQHRTDLPQRRSMDRRWLDGFDCFYPGDPRPADLPAASLWRSKDVYTDHMVRFYHAQGFPLSVVDNAGFMVGATGTCYGRGKAAWRSAAILALARGGALCTWYGDLGLLDDADGAWLGRVQRAYLAIQGAGATRAFGGVPGQGQAYGWHSILGEDGLIACVNPGMRSAGLVLPRRDARLLYADAGALPTIEGDRILLPPGQVALLGHGACREELGRGDGEPCPADWLPLGSASARTPSAADLRLRVTTPERLLLVLRQREPAGGARRTSGGAPPKGTPVDQLLRIEARQGDRRLAGRPVHDRMIWSGLSWGAVHLAAGSWDAGVDLEISAATSETAALDLELTVWQAVG